MKKLILASVSALALFGVAACSDSTYSTTTQSITPPPAEEPMAPVTPEATPPAGTDNSTTQSITPTPETGTGGEMQSTDPVTPLEPAPANPALAQ